MPIENTIKNSTLKSDPFAVCVEMVYSNIKCHKSNIPRSIKPKLAQGNTQKQLFLKFAQVFVDLAKLIDKYNLDIEVYFDITRPNSAVFNPKYFFMKQTFEKLQNTLNSIENDKFELHVVESISNIIKQCREKNIFTFEDYLHHDSIAKMCHCNKYLEFSIVLYVLTNGFKEFIGVKEQIVSLFNSQEIFTKNRLKVYNIIIKKFGSIEKTIQLINTEIRKA